MGREIRRVAPDWKHPESSRGLVPLVDDFAGAMRSFQEDPADWEHRPPNPEEYMPDFGDRATAYQVYENVSEGTPISPVFETEDRLLDWLMNDGSGLGIGGRRMPLTRQQAEAFVRSGFAPSMVFSNATGLVSGLELPDIAPSGVGDAS